MLTLDFVCINGWKVARSVFTRCLHRYSKCVSCECAHQVERVQLVRPVGVPAGLTIGTLVPVSSPSLGAEDDVDEEEGEEEDDDDDEDNLADDDGGKGGQNKRKSIGKKAPVSKKKKATAAGSAPAWSAQWIKCVKVQRRIPIVWPAMCFSSSHAFLLCVCVCVCVCHMCARCVACNVFLFFTYFFTVCVCVCVCV
jgi:hypothetical protein